MKKSIRLLAVLMSVIAMILGTATITFAAEDKMVQEDGKSSKGNVIIETKLDKDEYYNGDDISITVKVTNNNEYELTDIGLSYGTFPTAVSIPLEQKVGSIPNLEGGQSYEFTMTGTIVEGNARFPLFIVIIIAAAVIVVAAIVIFILMKKKKGKAATATASIIAVILVAGSILGVYQPAKASTITNIANAVTPADDEALAANTDYKRVSVHDPSVVKDEKTGTYYVFGSHLAFAKSTDLYEWTNFTTNISTDYSKLFQINAKQWSALGEDAGSTYDLRGNMWAPDVIWNETMQKWCMYMSINGDNWVSSICLLTADNIEGPYEYAGTAVWSGFANGVNKMAGTPDINTTDVYKVLGKDEDLTRYASPDRSKINAIDPCVCYDEEGNLWMTYGSWSAGIYQIKLDKSTGLRDYTYTYTYELNKSDAYFGNKIAGGYYVSGEAPYIIKSNGYYYLFVSLGGLEADGGYQIRIFRSESINGPFVDQNGKSAIYKSWIENFTSKAAAGVRVFSSYAMQGISFIHVAQGHNSALVDDDGKIYLVYHTRAAASALGGKEGHQVRVQQLFVNDDGWLVSAPYEYGGETISETGYTAEEMQGTYEFVIHTPNLVYKGLLTSGIVGSQSASTFIKCNCTLPIAGLDATKLSYRVDFISSEAETVTLNSDGTITGTYTGKWEVTEGANVKMTIDGVEYSGVFLKQQNEIASRDMMMTFTVLGENVTAWGVRTITE